MDSPDSFERVFHAELSEIAQRQGKENAEAVDRKELAGLALSGGGIRSATTSLGVLQALRNIGMLGVFDYLSTVSGGGFAGGWWSAWTSRAFDSAATPEEKFFPPVERIEPERERSENRLPDAKGILSDAEIAERREASDPVHHLRLFSNYLTPIKSLLSSDMRRVVTVISRNLVLTWIVLLPVLFAAVLLAQAYFTLQLNSESEFLYPYSHFNEDLVLNKELTREMAAAADLDRIVHGDTIEHNLLSGLTKKSSHGLDIQRIDPFIEIGHDLDSIKRRETGVKPIGVDKGEDAQLGVLNADLDSLSLDVQEWQRTDSLRNPLRHAALRAELDQDVDSVRSRLGELQATLIHHRWEMRDGWLFNGIHRKYLSHRVILATYIPIGLLAWIVMFVVLWIVNGDNKSFGGNVMQGVYAISSGLIVFWSLLWVVPEVVNYGEHPLIDSGSIAIVTLIWGVIGLFFLNRVLWDEAHWFWKANHRHMTTQLSQEFSKLLELRRARIALAHERLLLALVVSAVLLVFGGFGHEFINYLLFYRPTGSWDLQQWLTRVASAVIIVSAFAGAGIVANRAAPGAGGDKRREKTPGPLKRSLMALAPPFILLILLCAVSWVSHWILQEIIFKSEQPDNRDLISIVFLTWLFGAFSVHYAIQEMQFRRHAVLLKRLLNAVLVIPAISIVVSILSPFEFDQSLCWTSVGLFVMVWCIIFWKYRNERKEPEEAEEAVQSAAGTDRFQGRWRPGFMRTLVTIATSSVSITIVTLLLLALTVFFMSAAEMPFYWPYFVGLLVATTVFICDLMFGVRRRVSGFGGNHEARMLLGLNVTLCTVFLLIPPLSRNEHWGVTHVLAVLIFIALGLVVFVGWRLDPNALSVHAFYRGRLVRAYLGASNWLRGHASVSDVHPNDDVSLTSLKNCEHGAPYHLVNTTLNLLGAKSLEAAQRNASNFIMSKRYCGSVSTGYRPTEMYMSGEMTLGTAVAISGAAASPNMGSNRVSAAMTMLMSLLNIRLGYWAASPGESRWREAQPKLWPYYLIKESISATTGMGAFCYLTDGGHFDNTGLYPLIERACRYIVICDNGADPNSHFKDIGNAFRRCRIDFGAEFELPGLRVMTGLGTPEASVRPSAEQAAIQREHWLRGTVTYSDAHLRSIWGETWDVGLSEEEKTKYRTGTILVLKPIVLGDEPADVVQYSLGNDDFPQQSTADQWFSEDQFESYRRLGFWSAQSAFEANNYSNATRTEQLKAISTFARESMQKPQPATKV